MYSSSRRKKRLPPGANKNNNQTAISIDTSPQPPEYTRRDGSHEGNDELDITQSSLETKESGSRETQSYLDDMNPLKIHRLDLIVTIGLYYTSLIINSITLSSNSSSFFEFLFNLLFGSFALNQWKFGQLDLIGKITGLVLSLQSFIFLIAVGIYVFSKFSGSVKHSKGRGEGPEKTGKIHYGGPFQIVYLFKNFFSSNDSHDTYYDSLKKFDAQLSQFIGLLGYFLIIFAAIFAGSNEVTEIGASNAVAKSAYKAIIAAVILLAILNIVQWVIDIWRIGSDEIIIYEIIRNNSCCGGNKISKNSVGILDRNMPFASIPKAPLIKSTVSVAMTGSPTVVKTSTGITASPTASRSISPSKPSSRNSSPASSRPSSLANLSASSLSRSLQPSTVSTASPSQSRSALASEPPTTSSRTHYDLSPSRPLVVYPTETATYYSAPSAGIVERHELTQEVIYGGNNFDGQNLGTGNVGESTYDSNFEVQGLTRESGGDSAERQEYTHDSGGFDRQELVYGGDVDEGRPSSGSDVVERRELNTTTESQRLLPQRTSTIQRQSGLRRSTSSNRARRSRRNDSEESLERGRPR
ncbi:6574_t:CDS:1 [Acaulospora morrowiae]|uniref:6574_t:CDS:1 n=1 Tax=Acaulospora morrowiae TaxID=94023 RepID=A0A9N8VW24_9GLOM|nr:6574_t:CDS:1 [Acaulospora morrowiae]